MTSHTLPSMIRIEPKLLDHPWYRKWECGELPVDSLRTYAREYYWQVAHFPRYLSRLHSQMDDLSQRRVILDNLLEEENPETPHPELWLDFAEALGLERKAVEAGTPGAAAQELVEQFGSLMSSGVEQGLGALLAYESQVPEIARFKAKALESFYLKGRDAARGTRFFSVHQQADVWHTQVLEALLEELSPEKRQRAQKAANQACLALWKFLDAMPN